MPKNKWGNISDANETDTAIPLNERNATSTLAADEEVDEMPAKELPKTPE